MDNSPTKQKFPVGMILILILIGLGVLGSLYGLFIATLAQLGPWQVSGAGAIFATLVIDGIMATIFYGIIKRLKWAWKLSIGWHIFSLVVTPINMIFAFLANKTMQDMLNQKQILTRPALMAIILTPLLFAAIIQLIILIYIARKKDFFVN